MRPGHVDLDSLQALAKRGVLEGALTCNLEFGEPCVLDKKRKNLAPLLTARNIFLIMFTLIFGVLPRLYRLAAIGALSFLLMIYLDIMGYTSL